MVESTGKVIKRNELMRHLNIASNHGLQMNLVKTETVREKIFKMCFCNVTMNTMFHI